MESQRSWRRCSYAAARDGATVAQQKSKCWHYLIITVMLLILIPQFTNALPISQNSQFSSQNKRQILHRIPLNPTYETTTTTTENPPPKPFKYSYQGGRVPGGKPDRYVEQEGDGSGQIRGSYTYLDPNWTWQTIKYQADPDGGFRILEGSTLGMRPKDTVAVKKAKEEHAALFKMIAKRNQQPAEVAVAVAPQETRAVQEERQTHAELFQKIAEEHRLLAEEHKRLAHRQYYT